MQLDESQVASSDVAIILADGTKISRTTREVIKEIPQPTAQVSREIVTAVRARATLERMNRKLGDLPDIPQAMNPVAAIIVYSCIGLSDADIATALQATEAQIKTLKESETYSKLFELFDRTVFEDAKRGAKHIIARAADHAATRIVDAIDSDDPLISLAASRDVIKFSGVSLEQDTGNKMSGLHIRITRKDDVNDINVEIK